MTKEEIEYIRVVQPLIVDALQPYTSYLGWSDIGTTSEDEDMYGKADWIFSKEDEKFYVQLKYRSPKYEEYKDVRISLTEITALRKSKNISRYQIELTIKDTEYFDIKKGDIACSVRILDLDRLKELLPNIEVMQGDLNPECTPKYWHYYNPLNKRDRYASYVGEDGQMKYRFLARGKDKQFIVIPESFPTKKESLTTVLNLEDVLHNG